MKIGIVTIMDYTNYGNRLQNYAVSHVLQTRFDCDVVTLSAHPEKPWGNGQDVLWLKEQLARQLCRIPLAADHVSCYTLRGANFRNWSNRHIHTKNFYECPRLPETLDREFDLFFAGSDQIWNYDFSADRFADFFLKFAQPSKRAAISGSFGVEAIPDEWRQTYTDSLSGFAHLSVREEAGQRIIRELLGREVPVLVDPVMLLSREEWLKVSKKPRVDVTKPYVLKYYLGDEAEEEKIDHWARENGYAVYELLNDRFPELYSAGPGEFLSLIANAALVASDSFHCIAFSIIFRKPFVVYARRGSANYMTSRLDTLLGKFGFQDRWKHLLTPELYLQCDYSHVDAGMAAEQKKALAYIHDTLPTK